MTINYLPIFFDWPEATSALTAAEKGRLIDALVMYARGDEGYAALLRGREKVVFPVFVCQIDRAESRREEQSRLGQENGKKGGRPKKAAAEAKTEAVLSDEMNEKTPPFSEKPLGFEKNPYNNDKNNENDNEKENDNSGVAACRAATPGDTKDTRVTGETEVTPLEAYALQRLNGMTEKDLSELRERVSQFGERMVRYAIDQDYVRGKWEVASNQLIIWRMSHLLTPEDVERKNAEWRKTYGHVA